jgi:FolB domain-containing protein
MNPSQPLDRIRINDLMARTIVGFKEWERTKKQDVAISITLHVDFEKACQSDAVADTVDYKQIKNRVLELVEGSHFQLIERMAEAVARRCLEDPKVVRVDVVVDKLSALRFARSVSVEITRTRSDGGLERH